MKPLYLFLDDVRKPSDVHWVNLPENVAWTVVRNFDQFVEAVTRDGIPIFVSFDHDLADEHYTGFIRHHFNGDSYEQAFAGFEKTGLHCVRWLIDYLRNTPAQFPLYALHSMNPIGREHMKAAIDSYERHLSAVRSDNNCNP